MRSRIRDLYATYLKRTPTQSRSRVLVDAILHAANDRLSRSGDEDGITVNEVAARAGVSVGSLYQYFRDRGDLLGSLAAKVTEDNLLGFEKVLDGARAKPLREAIAVIVDHAFATYGTDQRVPRAILRIAHATNLMKELAASQHAFAQELASVLRENPEVRVRDVDIAAFVLTNSLMGIMHTLVWHEERQDVARLRGAIIEMVFAYLTHDADQRQASLD